jgi:hypothetical protein
MRRRSGVLALALLIAALAVGLTAGAAASAAGPPTAVGAKKKCKKKKKAHSAKKKKCKKQSGSTPAPAPSTSGPVVRATLTWGGGDGPSTQDMDLHVYDASGNEAGDAGNGTRSDAIPSTTLSPDSKGTSGSETFTDNVQPLRAFSFAVCNLGAGPIYHTPFTITYVTADGVTHTDSQNPTGGTDFTYPAGPPIPGNPCHRA